MILCVKVVAGESASQHIIASGSHSPDITGRLDSSIISHLLARHKLQGTTFLASDGQPTQTSLLKVFRKTEICQLRTPGSFFAAQQDILWLDIAMHESLFMCEGKALECLEYDWFGLF